MKHSISSTLSLGFLALILTCSPAYAAKQVATVVAARGDVQAFDAKGKGRPLAIQTPIFEEDSIKTGEHSQVQIMFSDNTLINLGNATTMKIAEYRWQPEQKDGALKTQVKEGTFRVMGGALTKTAPQNFKTETPTATIGIRGSMYAGFVTPDFLSVVFQGGKGIEITNAFGTVEITKPGFGTKVALAKPPLPPMKFTAKEVGEMNKSLSGNGAGEKKDEKEEKKDKSPTPKGDQGAMAPPTPEDKAAVGGGGTTNTPPPDPVGLNKVKDEVKDTVNKIGKDKTDKIRAVDVVDTAVEKAAIIDAALVPTTTSLAGNYRIFMRDNIYDGEFNYYYSTFLAWDSGAVNATLSTAPSGTGTLAASFLSNGAYAIEYDSSPIALTPFLTSFFAPYSYPGYAPTASNYTGFTSFTDTFSYNDAVAGLLTMTATNYVEPTGQFFYSTIAFSAPDFLVGGLIYAGVPSGSVPASGIDKFTGHLIYTSPNSLNIDADMEETRTTVNYNNKRIIGRSSDNNFQEINKGAVFFGTMAANGTANVTILGGGDSNFNGGGGNDPTSASGSATVTLYGGFHQGLAFTASGADYSVIDNTQTGTWEAIGAALRSPTRNTTPDPTSPLAYTGFFIGVGDKTSNGYANRIYANSTASDVALSVNPTTGVLSGTIANLNDLYTNGEIRNLTIGGNQDNSAYVANNDMVAILTGADLKTHGNFLVTAGPDAPTITTAANDFMTWGYWEIAYYDNVSELNAHLFGEQSFFVIGQQTDPAYITNNLLNTAFTGTYNGKAFGVKIDDLGQFTTPMTNGTTQLAINFQHPGWTDAITGTISFDQAVLAINSGESALNANGFNAYVSSVTVPDVAPAIPVTSQVNGTFYGPHAEAVGGNFHAKMSNVNNGVRYLGVFGGNR